MKVSEFFKKKEPVFSFEFFLPKTDQARQQFFAALTDLKKLNPSFVTLTYGAAGSARSQTLEMAGVIKKQFGFTTMMHLTGIAHTRREIQDIVKELQRLDIDNIMTLRGDPPKEGPVLPFEQRDYKYAVDLVRHLRQLGDFCLGVAGYPEGHPEAASKEEDLEHLKEKVAAGAHFVTTQLFFNNADYFEFTRRARKSGIAVPIVPGIMPITNFKQIQKFTNMCGASLPPSLAQKLEPVADDLNAVAQIGVDHATAQCRELLAQGAPGIHFYTLNQSKATQIILKNLKNHAS